MKHFVFRIPLLISALLTSACSFGEKPFPYSTTTIEPSYEPSEDIDPFPEYVAPEIDTSTFTLDNIPVNFATINDFHGQVDEEKDDNRVGLAKMSTYLKDRKAQGDILISSGDMYQGSFMAGVDHGQFVSHAFKNIGFDAYIIGNHEFDWGINPLLNNQLATGQEFLGANLYRYPYNKDNPEKYQIGDDYKIINLYKDSEFEVKVGVIGVIGKNQISSIKSLYTSDLVFVDPTDIVKNLAIKLKEEEHCDFVIASYHDDAPDKSIADYVNNKSYRYVDACFMAHTHKYQHYIYNNVPFIQASAYSRGVSLANFSFNKITKQIKLNGSKYQYLASLNLEEDPLMKEKIQERKNLYETEYNKVIGVNNAGELSVGQMSQLYAYLSYEKEKDKALKDLGISIKGCFFNESRRSLKAGEITYSNLYETHPFMNDLYIVNITGKDLINQKNRSYGYLYPNEAYKSDQRYDVIVYDYNGFHISVNNNYEKYYNYFPSAFSNEAAHSPIKLDFTSVSALVDYLKDNTIEKSFFKTSGLFSK